MKRKLVIVVVLTILLSVSNASQLLAKEISLASWQWNEPGFGTWYREAAKAFEAETGVKVVPVEIPNPIYEQTLFNQFMSGEGPDIVAIDGAIESYMAVGGLVPLDEFIEQSSLGITEWSTYEFVEEFNLSVDGQQYGIFYNWMANAMFYNKRLLEEAGVDVPTYPEEFFEAAVALTKDGQYGYPFYNGSGPQLVNEIRNWQMLFDGSFFDPDNPPYPTIDTPHNIAALHFMKRLIDAGVTPVGLDKSLVRQMFWEERGAFLIDGIWMWGFFQEENPSILDDIGVAPLPGYTQRNWAGGNRIGITSFAEDKALAWSFLEFLLSPEWQSKLFEYTGTLPASGELPADVVAENPWVEAFLYVMPYGELGSKWPGAQVHYPQLQNMIEDLGSSILHRNVSPRVAAERSQGDVERFLKDEGLID